MAGYFPFPAMLFNQRLNIRPCAVNQALNLKKNKQYSLYIIE